MDEMNEEMERAFSIMRMELRDEEEENEVRLEKRKRREDKGPLTSEKRSTRSNSKDRWTTQEKKEKRDTRPLLMEEKSVREGREEEDHRQIFEREETSPLTRERRSTRPPPKERRITWEQEEKRDMRPLLMEEKITREGTEEEEYRQLIGRGGTQTRNPEMERRDTRPPLIDGKSTGEEEEKRKEKEREERAREENAKSRQVYDPQTKEYDERKRRVTDLKECSRVTLPKPLNITREAQIQTRREIHSKIFRQYVQENCKKEGEQKTNLTEQEERGLKSLMKRIYNISVTSFS